MSSSENDEVSHTPNSPVSENNQFTTPDTSPEPTETDLRILTNSLTDLRRSLSETELTDFETHLTDFSSANEDVQAHFARRQQNQVSPPPLDPVEESVLRALDRVKNLLDQEVEIASSRCSSLTNIPHLIPEQQLNSLVSQKIAF